jgi:hypothetical protein
MIIGSGFIDYGRAALIEELLSARQGRRNCRNANVLENAFLLLKAASRFARWLRSFCCRRMNVFGSRPDADEARRKRTQRRKPLKEPQ